MRGHVQMMSAKILGLFNLPPLSTQPPFLSSAIAHGSQPRINNLCQGPILVRDFVTHVACMLQKCRNAGSRNERHAPLVDKMDHQGTNRINFVRSLSPYFLPLSSASSFEMTSPTYSTANCPFLMGSFVFTPHPQPFSVR